MANFDAQLQRMQSLMTYGAVKENKKQVTGAMEYHAIGADGKAYGIIRENQKFYIKTADKKNEMLVESYDYIGGFNNKKQYEYNMLSDAKKNFDMKLMSIKESYSPKTNFSLTDFEVKGDYMSDCGKNMMNEIARQRQIMNNAAAIMNENSTIGCDNTGNPEAPKTMSFTGKAGAPFTETATASLDKDMKETASDPEKQGEPFGDKSKAEEYKDAQYVPSGSVANQKPKGGKVVKVDESTMKVWEMMSKLDKSFSINEACEDWGSQGLQSEGNLMEDDDFNPVTEEDMMEEPIMEDDDIAGFDDEEGMEFADDNEEFESEDEEGMDPEEVEGEDLDFDFDDEESMEDDEYDFEDYGDDEESEVDPDEMEGAKEAEEDMENPDESELEMLRNEIEELRAEIAALKGENGDSEEGEFEVELDGEEDMGDEEDFDFEDYGNGEDMEYSDDEEMDEESMEDETFDPEVDANYEDEDENFGIDESRKAQLEPIIESLTRRYLKEDKLNDFGKHPGYRKKPMSLPTTGSDEGDWNDSSVYSEQPFGQKIGDSAPFDKVVNVITDSVMEALTGKKKI